MAESVALPPLMASLQVPNEGLPSPSLLGDALGGLCLTENGRHGKGEAGFPPVSAREASEGSSGEPSTHMGRWEDLGEWAPCDPARLRASRRRRRRGGMLPETNGSAQTEHLLDAGAALPWQQSGPWAHHSCSQEADMTQLAATATPPLVRGSSSAPPSPKAQGAWEEPGEGLLLFSASLPRSKTPPGKSILKGGDCVGNRQLAKARRVSFKETVCVVKIFKCRPLTPGMIVNSVCIDG